MSEVQYVGVEFRTSAGRSYTYQYSGEKTLHVGDRVMLPANWANPQPSFGDVTHVFASREEITYAGALAEILDVVPNG